MRVFVGDYEYCVEEGNEAEDVKEMLEELTYETYAEQGATTNRTGPCFGELPRDVLGHIPLR